MLELTFEMTYDCPDCRRAEMVVLVDEHEDAWACTVCGAALFVDLVLDLEAAQPSAHAA